MHWHRLMVTRSAHHVTHGTRMGSNDDCYCQGPHKQIIIRFSTLLLNVGIPVDDLKGKLEELDRLQSNIQKETSDRAHALEEAVQVADRFNHTYSQLMQALRDVNDNLASQDSPGVDTSTIRQQQNELLVSRYTLFVLNTCTSICSYLSTLDTSARWTLNELLDHMPTFQPFQC